MDGVGTHLKKLIAGWLGVKTGGCGGCERLLKEMDKNGPEWCRRNLKTIVPTIQQNAQKNKDWKARILSRIPGIRAPIIAIIFLAIARAEEDLREAEAAKKDADATDKMAVASDAKKDADATDKMAVASDAKKDADATDKMAVASDAKKDADATDKMAVASDTKKSEKPCD